MKLASAIFHDEAHQTVWTLKALTQYYAAMMVDKRFKVSEICVRMSGGRQNAQIINKASIENRQ